jgi:hypothetical protein
MDWTILLANAPTAGVLVWLIAGGFKRLEGLVKRLETAVDKLAAPHTEQHPANA